VVVRNYNQIKGIETRGSCFQQVRRKIELHTCLDETRREEQLGRPRHRWQDLKTDLQEIRESVDWIDLAQEKGKWRALLKTEVNLGVPYNQVTFLTISGAISFKEGSASWT
jgi:hypothetical protein